MLGNFSLLRVRKFLIKLQASAGCWNEANTTLLQWRWYCSMIVLALFQFRLLLLEFKILHFLLVSIITMVTTLFGLTRGLTLFGLTRSLITSKSLINKKLICIFHLTHFCSTIKLPLTDIKPFFSCKFVHFLLLVQSSNQICIIR